MLQNKAENPINRYDTNVRVDMISNHTMIQTEGRHGHKLAQESKALRSKKFSVKNTLKWQGLEVFA